MDLAEIHTDEQLNHFIAQHRAALAANEPRHIVMLALLALAEADCCEPPLTWSFDEGGACAVQGPGMLILGDLSEEHCATLASVTAKHEYPGVVGPDMTAKWFVEHAQASGRNFRHVMPQRVLALENAPRYPETQGAARVVTGDDASLLGNWLDDFSAEAVPDDPPMLAEHKAALAASGKCFFWEVAGRPVSMAAIVRETENTAGISLVYTPPAERTRGYAGAATAATVEAAYRRGKTSACLFTDLRNPISNRCYEKIGFVRVCDYHTYLSLAD